MPNWEMPRFEELAERLSMWLRNGVSGKQRSQAPQAREECGRSPGRRPQKLCPAPCKNYCIHQIPAHSPQAKGRIERPWRTSQDRLSSELRLAQACTLEQANAVLTAFLVAISTTALLGESAAFSAITSG